MTLTDPGSPVAKLTLVGDYSGDDFAVTNDPNITGAVDIAFCFCRGTLIETPNGQIAVEALSRGDMVTTTAGAVKPVTWIGRQTVFTRFADPLRVSRSNHGWRSW